MYKVILVSLLTLYTCISVADKKPSTPHSGTLSLEDIYKAKRYETLSLDQTLWQDNGDSYTTLEDSNIIKGSEDIIRYDSHTGQRSILVSAKQLILKKGEKPAKIAAYRFIKNNQQLLLFTNTQNTWRHADSGDYWLINLTNGKKKKIGGTAKPGELYFADIAPTGDKIAYMYEHNLYVEMLNSGEIKQLTHDGSEMIVNGGFDWAYEEEFNLRKTGGFRWSPDGNSLAYWQTNMEGVGTFNLINNTDDIYSKVIPIQYPKVGTTNSAIKTGVVNIDSGKTIWFDFKGDSRNYYLPRMQWAGNSNSVAIQHLNRKQNTLSLYLGDPKNGQLKLTLQEKNKTWLETVDDLTWFNNGESFSWVSERDGWNRVYIYSRSGKLQRAITPEKIDAIPKLNFNNEAGWLYYHASPDNPTQRYLFRAQINGKGQAEKITPANQPGVHEYNISPNQKWALHSHSRLMSPTHTDFIALPNHQQNRIIIDNQKIKQQLAALPKTEHEYFRVSINKKIDVDGWMIKPANFDPALKYPLVIYVYAEPWSQSVIDQWSGSFHQFSLWHKFLAEQGYIVVSVDNRGTPAPRGRQWRKSIYKKLGELTSADQAAAARNIVKWDFIDAERVAVWGRSGGGSHTLHALFRYPDLYKTGISVAPVPDLLLYDSIYQERYSGVLPEDIESYKENSAISYAQNLKGNLLIIHGTADSNVHYQGSEKLMAKLIENNRLFSVIPYPNKNHSIRYGRNTILHKRSSMFHFLQQHVPPGGIPQ